MDFKLELVAIPVTGIARAKSFYADEVGVHRTTTSPSATRSGSCSSRRQDRPVRSP
jgi:extradiol dioxygenase family protein